MAFEEIKIGRNVRDKYAKLLKPAYQFPLSEKQSESCDKELRAMLEMSSKGGENYYFGERQTERYWPAGPNRTHRLIHTNERLVDIQELSDDRK